MSKKNEEELVYTTAEDGNPENFMQIPDTLVSVVVNIGMNSSRGIGQPIDLKDLTNEKIQELSVALALALQELKGAS